jgi:hypothetical protein
MLTGKKMPVWQLIPAALVFVPVFTCGMLILLPPTFVFERIEQLLSHNGPAPNQSKDPMA